MRYFPPILVTLALGTLTILASPGLTRAADNHMFDQGMRTILASYLKIQEALAADSTDGVQAAARSIAKDAAKLQAGGLTGEHAVHHQDLVAKLRDAAEALSRAATLETAREAFKQLSEPMVSWGMMAKPTGVDVLSCAMAKARWLQTHGDVRNPYYGRSMLTCGEVIGTAGHATGAIQHGH